jgi:predicted outer membrane repeat protein
MLSTIKVSSTANSGPGTLRAAIERADLDGAHDTIKFARSVTGTISLASALPDLSTHITIAGPGASALTVARNVAGGTPAFRIFTVPAGGVVTIIGLTISGGMGPIGGGIDNGGSLSLFQATVSGNSASDVNGGSGTGGGISNQGTLSITNSTLSGNSAQGGGGSIGFSPGNGIGGGISNTGTLTITNSTLSGNSASDVYGGDSGKGGGISNTGTVTITNSTLSGNSAQDDGGGISSAGTLTITNSTLSGNSAIGGGGISNTGTLTITYSTLSGNSANHRFIPFPISGMGGGILNQGALTINNSTLSGNSVYGGNNVRFGMGGPGIGGGISNQGTLSITNSTLSGNSANGGGGSIGFGIGSGIGGGISSAGSLSLVSDTISDNVINGGAGSGGGGVEISSGQNPIVESIDSIFKNPIGGNVTVTSGGVFRSLGHNLFSDAPALSVDPTDLVDTDPLLGPLADNGGPTMTIALLPGSPAINGGIPVVGITTDQRGAPRLPGIAPDIGAFEVQSPLTVVSLQRYGIHDQPTALVLTFNLPLDASRAKHLANYRLVLAGPDHPHGTRHERVLPLRSARYDPASQTVTLRPKRQLLLKRTYLLTVIGMPPEGLTTTVGAYLAGAGTSQPGSNYVATFTRKSLVIRSQK